MSEGYRPDAVALLVFNRPDVTSRVFEAIRAVRPRRLFIVADGARPNRPQDAQLCEATRAVTSQVDWDCEVFRDYSDVNLGCKRRVSTGISWVFKQVEEAIILEDDCLPHPSFFRFCTEMLAKYRHDSRVAMVSGDKFPFIPAQTSASYRFSRFAHIWGWATWRRAWDWYDVNMIKWPFAKKMLMLDQILNSPQSAAYWTEAFDRTFEGKIDTWDYQWQFALWAYGSLCIAPAKNLVSNIGFRADATHTRGDDVYANLDVEEMAFPLAHPDLFLRDIKADEFTERNLYSRKPLLQRAIRRLRSSLRRSK